MPLAESSARAEAKDEPGGGEDGAKDEKQDADEAGAPKSASSNSYDRQPRLGPTSAFEARQAKALADAKANEGVKEWMNIEDIQRGVFVEGKAGGPGDVATRRLELMRDEEAMDPLKGQRLHCWVPVSYTHLTLPTICSV